MLENQENVKSRSDKGYHAVLPPYTGNYIPSKPDLMFIDEQVESKSVDVVSTVSSSVVKTVESKVKFVDVKNKGVYSTVETKTVRKNSFSPPIIEDWNSNDESEVEFKPKVEVKTVRPCIEKIKFVKTVREKVENVETPKQHKHYPRGNQRNWNNLMSQRLGSNFKMINKACYVCGSFEHLQYDCDKMVVRPVWNNSKRVNHKNFANKLTHPHPKRNFAPQAVLMRSIQVSLNTRQTVNSAKPVSNVINKAHSNVRSPFNQRTAFKNRNINQKVNAVKRNSVNTVVGNEVYAVKALGCWVWRHKQNVIDHVSKQNSASMTLKRFDYIDVQGRFKLKLKELMELSTKLSDRVIDLEKIKTTQANEIADLKKRVKKLERKRRSMTLGMNLFKIGTSRRRSLGEEDASKQGRNLKQRSIFEESDFDVQAMMDADYELAARLRAE
uniref:Ribonuclease H-like domain-containing protein n=1 Tax=Tanacetum cinerariifolium TaxID=118510 RepID=A0A699H2Q5_TANCI|nr:ribonuclease H-like domain-containing protein [Tanacetum cinerariifolium]